LKRGVIFTLDALVAVVIAVMALTILAPMLSLNTSSWSKEIVLYNSAQDFLTSRDKDGTLAGTFTSTDANAVSSLNSLLAAQIPPNMVAQLNITYCNYTASSFSCNRNIVAGQNGTTQIKSVVRRVFTEPANNYYGVAVITVWYK
jgi:hypothetical protein